MIVISPIRPTAREVTLRKQILRMKDPIHRYTRLARPQIECWLVYSYIVLISSCKQLLVDMKLTTVDTCLYERTLGAQLCLSTGCLLILSNSSMQTCQDQLEGTDKSGSKQEHAVCTPDL